MKKIFSFVFAVALTTSLWATQTVVPVGENNVKAAVEAAQAGDTLLFQTGSYTDWSSFTIAKKLTFLAAEDAQPQVALYNIKIQAEFEANGLAISNVSKDNYLFRVYDNVAGTVAFKNCSFKLHAEVTAVKSYIIVKEGKTLSSLVIDNCLFKDNATVQGAIVLASGATTAVSSFSMTNSTAYNCGTELAVWFEGLSNVNVDHCSFYNCGTRTLYFTGGTKNEYLVQNCVFANAAVPASNTYCVASYAGNVKNIVYFNIKAPRSSDATLTGCIEADPKFVDVANANFDFAFTSPLSFTATDGSNIGDPRWKVDTSVGTATSIPATLSKNDAVLCGPKISLTDNGIKWGGNGDPTVDFASWKVNIAQAGAFEVVLNVSANSTSGHKYSVSLFDAEGKKGLAAESAQVETTGAIVLGMVNAPAAGTYMVRLNNATAWSSATVESITLNAKGGGVIEIPANTVLTKSEAILVGSNVSMSEGNILWGGAKDSVSSYAAWNINVTKSGQYEVVLSAETVDQGHEFHVFLYDGDEQLGEVAAPRKWEPYTDKSLGNLTVETPGQYMIRVYNLFKYGRGAIAELKLNYKGGAVVELPDTLRPADAMLSEKAFVDNDSILFAPRGSEGYNSQNWAKWNVNVAAKAKYFFAANVKSVNGYRFAIEVFDANNQSVYAYSADSLWDGGQDALDLGSKILEAGAYTVKMQNIYNYSKGRLMYVAVTKEDLPVELTISEEDTDNAQLTANIDKTVNVNLVRKLVPGMFNTICLPFGVSSSVLAASEFAGAQIYQLDSTYLQGDEVILCFKANSDFYQGVPYLVQPDDTITNPSFEGVVIKKDKGSTSTSKGGYACFRGTLVKKQLTAGDEKLLYLGQENKLYFPEVGDETSMKGLRGYFEILQEDPTAPIRRAAIRMGTDVITTLDLVDGQAIPNNKFMLNGQIVIRVNGVDYMLNGARR